MVDKDQLRKIPGVAQIEDMGNFRWKLITSKPDELRKSIMKWALEKDINIASLQTETQTMEDVFRSATK